MSRSAETAMWWSDDETRRSDETVIYLEEARQALAKWQQAGVEMIKTFAEMGVTLCDAGTGEDLAAHIASFKPHDAAIIEQRARDLAAERETW